MSVITNAMWTVCGGCGYYVLDDVRKRRCSTAICWTSYPSTSPPPQCRPAVGINCLHVHTGNVCSGTLTGCDRLPGASACLGGASCGTDVAGLNPILYTPQSPAPPDSRPPPVPTSRTSAPFLQHDTPVAAMPIQYRALLRIDCVHRRSGGRRATVPLLHGAAVCILLSRQLHHRLVLEQ